MELCCSLSKEHFDAVDGFPSGVFGVLEEFCLAGGVDYVVGDTILCFEIFLWEGICFQIFSGHSEWCGINYDIGVDLSSFFPLYGLEVEFFGECFGESWFDVRDRYIKDVKQVQSGTNSGCCAFGAHEEHFAFGAWVEGLEWCDEAEYIGIISAYIVSGVPIEDVARTGVFDSWRDFVKVLHYVCFVRGGNGAALYIEKAYGVDEVSKLVRLDAPGEEYAGPANFLEGSGVECWALAIFKWKSD